MSGDRDCDLVDDCYRYEAQSDSWYLAVDLVIAAIAKAREAGRQDGVRECILTVNDWMDPGSYFYYQKIIDDLGRTLLKSWHPSATSPPAASSPPDSK